MGPPRSEVIESKAPKRFSNYMAVMTNLHESNLLFMRRHPRIRFEEIS